MHKQLDFNNTKPFFVDGNVRWFKSEELQRFIDNSQDFNLPKLENIYGFIVIDESRNIQDYVIIDDKQSILHHRNYTKGGYDSTRTFLTALKISKHYDDQE